MRSALIIPIILLALTVSASGQSMGGTETGEGDEAAPTNDTAPGLDTASGANPGFDSFQPPPRGFGELNLGLSFDAAEDALYRDGNFYYRGKTDLTMLRRPNERMIETAGIGYIQRSWLQFYEGKLYAITLDIDERMMDHYALYTTFTEKYGPPDQFSPLESRWSGEDHDFVLERESLRVKYLDRELIETIRRSGNIEESLEELDRDRFLEQF